MSRPPLGQVCIELGLLDDAQVVRILQDMHEHGQGRFGELAVGLNLLSEEALAQALAEQFQVPLLPRDRVARLDVPREVLRLLPTALMRGRLLLPTYFDPDRRTLSVVTSDPTDVPTLQAAQRLAQADRLRMFVAARSAVAAQLDRLLPPGDEDIDELPLSGMEPREGGTVVLETDVEIASALRRLNRAEGVQGQIVPDPEQVTAILRGGMADRVIYREALAESAAPYLSVWRGVRPGVHLAGIRGFSPGRRVALGYRALRAFYQELLLWVLTAGGIARPLARQRVRAAFSLARELGAQLRLSDEQVEAVGLVAMLTELPHLAPPPDSACPAGPGDALFAIFEQPVEVLARFQPPWDLVGLQAAVERRLNRPGEVTEHLSAELLIAVRYALEHGLAGASAADDVLPEDLRVNSRVKAALTRVLHRRLLRASLLTAGRRRAVVLVAVADLMLLTDIEERLEARGFEVLAFADATTAIAAVPTELPAAVVVAGDLPEDGAHRLLEAVRQHPPSSDTPVFVLDGGAGIEQVLAELRPGRVIPPPCDLDALETALLTVVPRAGLAARASSATGDHHDLLLDEVVDLLQLTRSTAAVQVVADDVQGVVYLVDGQLRAARLGRSSGDEAWLAMRELPKVRYAITFGQRPADDEGGILHAVGISP